MSGFTGMVMEVPRQLENCSGVVLVFILASAFAHATGV